MKKLLAIVLTVTLLLSSVLVAIPVNAAGETEPTRALPVALENGYTPEGTEITDKDDFYAKIHTGGKYYLSQDLVLDRRTTAIAENTVLDGNGHTITYTGTQALFGWAKNITIKNLIFTGSVTVNAGSGSIYNESTLTNGFEGPNNVISNVYSDCSLTLTGESGGSLSFAGGLYGKAGDGGSCVNFSDVIVEGDITVSENISVDSLGGIIGYVNGTPADFKMTNCKYSGTITANKTYNLGGLVGRIAEGTGMATFKDCVNEANLTNNTQNGTALSYTGGVVGYLGVGASFTDCTNRGLIAQNNAKGGVGGIVAYSSRGLTLLNCDNLAAASDSAAEIRISYASVGGDHRGAGGIVGTVNGGSVSATNCDNRAAIAYTSPAEGNTGDVCLQMGGIIGRVNNGGDITIANCTNTGDITSNSAKAGWDGAGGMLGTVADRSSASTYSISNCVNTGNVSVPGCAGGMFGNTIKQNHTDISIAFSNCLNYGDVTSAGTSAGGIAASIYVTGGSSAYKMSINNCVNAGDVTSNCTRGDVVIGKVAGILAMYKSHGERANITIEDENVPSITNCVNAGAVYSSHWTAHRPGNVWNGNAAGILAYLWSPIKVENCVNMGSVATANNDPAYYYGAFPITQCYETQGDGMENKFDTTLLSANGNIYLEGTCLQVGLLGDKITDSTSADKATVYAKLKTLNTYGYSTAAVEAEIGIFNNSMVQSEYLPSTWTAYSGAVEAARETLATYIQTAPLSRYQYQLNDAETAVVNAKAALVKKADFYKAITDAIAATDGLVEDDYTKGSWANLQLAINAGNSLMTQVSEDATAVANAAAAITAAQGALIDAGLLGDIYDAQARADALTEENYTAASWATMEEKYAAAQDVIDNYSDDLEKIEIAAKDLNDAIDALIDISELKNAIATTIDEEKYYTEDSYAGYTSKLEAANTALTATSQDDVDTAKNELLAAIDALEHKLTNEDQLGDVAEKIEVSNTLNESYYTEETWNEFADALARVEALNANSTMVEVDAAMSALALAESKLVKSEASASDYEILEGLINSAYELEAEDYVADTYNALMEKVYAAEALSDAETKETIEAAIADIEEAFELLVKAPEADTAEEELEAKIEGLSARDKIAVAIASKRKPAQSNKNLSAIVDALA